MAKNTLRSLASAEDLVSCAPVCSHSAQSILLGLHDAFDPSRLLLLASPAFSAQHDSSPASSADGRHGKAPPSGRFHSRYREDPRSPVCHIHPRRCARWTAKARWCGRWFIRRQSALPREGSKENMGGFCRLPPGRGKWMTTGAGVQPARFWKTSKASPSQERTHGGYVWQWHLKKNHSESCAWSFNCCGHGPSSLPKSNVNGLRKLVFFSPSTFTLRNVWQPFYCVYKLWTFWAANYENIEKSDEK